MEIIQTDTMHTVSRSSFLDVEVRQERTPTVSQSQVSLRSVPSIIPCIMEQRTVMLPQAIPESAIPATNSTCMGECRSTFESTLVSLAVSALLRATDVKLRNMN